MSDTKRWRILAYKERCFLSRDLQKHLSLDKISSFTYVGVPKDDPSSMLLRTEALGLNHWKRLCRHRTRPLKTLRARFYNPPGVGARPSSGDAERLLSFFDPEHVLLSSWAGPEALQDKYFKVDLTHVDWTRLRSLSLHCVHGIGLLASSHLPFGRLPTASLALQFDMVNVPRRALQPYKHYLVIELINATDWMDPLERGAGIPAVREFRFRIESEELKRYVEEFMSTMLYRCGFTRQQIQEKTTPIRFEIVRGMPDAMVSPVRPLPSG